MQQRGLSLALPKMAAGDLEQAAREREGPVAVYHAFQSELAKLRQRAAMAYAQLAAETPSLHLKEEEKQQQQPPLSPSSNPLGSDTLSNVDKRTSALQMKLLSSGSHSIRMTTEVCVCVCVLSLREREDVDNATAF